jgi:hypothetical protein
MDNLGQRTELAPHAVPKYWVFFGLLAVLGLFAGAIGMQGNAAAKVLSIGFILIGIAGPVCYWLWLANTRLVIGPGVAGYQNLFGARRVWPTSEIARAVQLMIVYPSRYGDQAKPALLLVGADGRCLQKVRIAAWSDGDVAAFGAATGQSLEYIGSYSPVEANKEFPRSVGWMYAYPGRSAAIAAGIVAAIGAAVVVSSLSSR